MKYAEQQIGIKRYKLLKPDNTETNVNIDVLMGHVLPLMRYTNGFKMNIDVGFLDMPRRADFHLMLKEKMQGEEMNYIIDRFSTLCSIIFLASKPDGQLCGLFFCSIKALSWCSVWWSSYQAIVKDDQAKLKEKHKMHTLELQKKQKAKGGGSLTKVAVADAAGTGTDAGEGAPLVPKNHPAHHHHSWKVFFQRVLKALFKMEVTVQGLQTLTLVIICIGLFGGIPPPLCGVVLILVCSITMLYMNLATAKEELTKAIIELGAYYTSLLRQATYVQEQVLTFLAGDNPFDIQFLVLERSQAASTSTTANEITLLVPALGISFSGEPVIDRVLLPKSEQRAMELSKKMAFYQLKQQAHDDHRIKSIRQHSRFESDIVPSLSVALGVDQMMMREKIPPIMATLQCANHLHNKISRPEYDSFLTLFKPADWEEEFDDMEDKVEEMLTNWKKEVAKWMKHTLGAVESDRTASKEIQEQINGLLQKECTGAMDRALTKVTIKSIMFPPPAAGAEHSIGDLDGKPGFASVLYETENVTLHFPAERMTEYGKITRVNQDGKSMFKLEVNSTVTVAIPLGVNRVRFAVWAQDMESKTEELVAYTSEIDLQKSLESSINMQTGEYNVEQEAPVHTQWRIRGLKGIEPLGGDILDEEEARIQKELEEEAEEAKGFLGKLQDKIVAGMMTVMTCACFKKELTDEEIDASRGKMSYVFRPPTQDESEDDLRVMKSVKDITGGGSAMNLAKVERHADRWMDLANMFGVHLTDQALVVMDGHVNKLKDYAGKLSFLSTQASREEKCLEFGIRRQLQDTTLMQKAIAKMERHLTALKDKNARMKSLFGGSDPWNPSQLNAQKISGRIYNMPTLLKTYEGPNGFTNELLDKLWEFQQMSLQTSKQILHYVIVSDHIKPSKKWRPDAVTNHVAAIVRSQLEDVPEVMVTGIPGVQKDITFLRQTMPNSMQPATCNSRLIFKATERILDDDDIFLYWDGKSRWVISPFRGKPAPYGATTPQEVAYACKFFWVKDNATSPNQVTEPWMKYEEAKSRWKKEQRLKVLGKGTTTSGGKGAAMMQDLETGADMMGDFGEEEESGGLMMMIQETMEEIVSLFKADKQKIDPELKECLVGLAGHHIEIAWRDDKIEELAPFRTFLLEEFSTYARAWLFLTRSIALDRPTCQSNLVAMFHETIFNIERNIYLSEKTASEPPSPSRGAGGDSPSRREQKEEEEEGRPNLLSTTFSRALTMTQDSKATLLDFLEAVDHEALAAELMALIDEDGSGFVNVEELQALYVLDEEDTAVSDRLKEFKNFLNAHPEFKDSENMWARLSRGLEIEIADFTKAARTLMMKFIDKAVTGMSPEEKAKRVFQQLDVQMSGGISLGELIPSSGPLLEDVNRSLLRFNVPLAYLSELKLDPRQTFGVEKNKALKLTCNPQFCTSPEWSALRLALDPDWKANPHSENIVVCMRPEYFDLWMKIITESQMHTAQESVRFYDGAYQEHTTLRGTYMRDGLGVQRWANGQLYSGTWKHHVYNGEGALYASARNVESQTPLYDGNWRLGKRHGEGSMHWEQETHDKGTSEKASMLFGIKPKGGIGKVYEGQFRDDLFHGRGRLQMERAVAQQLPSRQPVKAGKKAIPFPTVDPSLMQYFNGTFESHWDQVDKYMRETDPLYEKNFPEPMLDLNLQNLDKDAIKPYHADYKKYETYLGMDGQVQKAGPPMYDLAQAFYRKRNADMTHMKHGQAKYADGSEYEGDFENKVPHGEGMLNQYELGMDGKRRLLTKYTGQWQNGLRHGSGTYEVMGGVKYEGAWVNGKRNGKGKQTVPQELQSSDSYGYIEYDGDWVDDFRVGQGRLLFGEGDCVYVGAWDNNLRHGKGAIKRLVKDKEGKNDELLLYLGNFQNDRVNTTQNQPAWARLAGYDLEGADSSTTPGKNLMAEWLSKKTEGQRVKERFYYGQLSPEGLREGYGILFEAHPADPQYKAFIEAFEKGSQYKETRPQLNFTLYEGEWVGNLPQGTGLQHFKGQGVYEGDFLAGNRHGRGTWKTVGGAIYRPIENSTQKNWENDLMHGIAIVEDLDHVHENVIFTQGECRMPFVEIGPPLTGFDRTPVIGNVVAGARAGANLARQAVRGGASSGLSAPAMSCKETAEGGTRKAGKKKTASGDDAVWSHAEQTDTAIIGRLVKREDPDFVQSHRDAAPVTLVRTPTDLGLPEEDVLIRGGRAYNEAINGLYFKINNVYDLPIYKLVKRLENGEAVQRFLWKEKKKGYWIISMKPQVISQNKACAFVDLDVPEPAMIDRPWYVWYEPTKNMRCHGEEEEKVRDGQTIKVKMDIDPITASSVVGFEVLGVSGSEGGPQPGILLRQKAELFGRPVYEAESGGQYLYWMKKDAAWTEGTTVESKDFSADATTDAASYFEGEGHWVLAREPGEAPRAEGCLAYVEENCVTPDLIGKKWQVRIKGSFSELPAFQLKMEEWRRADDLLGKFDGAESPASPAALEDDPEHHGAGATSSS
eukprot:TRINITY_DN121473_c0_g1_i1.p1 TRINITY_DN121473_c0_g1~~TRINITY_DN121473_c0_g1_i1.p1  ORF type:complete len:2646 (+),score=729.13 TRINITY_DN121473_c0_g1_i1:454-7938(+)